MKFTKGEASPLVNSGVTYGGSDRVGDSNFLAPERAPFPSRRIRRLCSQGACQASHLVDTRPMGSFS
jgi:hypothetical protein